MIENQSIRTAAPADAAAVDALTQAAYAKWVPVLGRKPMPMTVDYHRAVVEHRIDLLEIDGHLAALVEMAAEHDHLLIENLAVHPDFQRRGLGSALLTHAETLARQLGLTELRLYTNGLMAVNIALYLRRGYAETRREERESFGVVVHMSKMLNSRALLPPRLRARPGSTLETGRNGELDFDAEPIGRYVRIVAIIALLLGLNDAARLLGVSLGAQSPIVALGVKPFVLLAIFTLALLFASVGLWIKASWGAVLLVAAVAAELVLYLIGDKDVEMTVYGFGVRLVLLAAIVAIFILNFRMRRAAAAHD